MHVRDVEVKKSKSSVRACGNSTKKFARDDEGTNAFRISIEAMYCSWLTSFVVAYEGEEGGPRERARDRERHNTQTRAASETDLVERAMVACEALVRSTTAVWQDI